MTCFRQVLAALDVHTARWIINKCFRSPGLLSGRTVLLVVSHGGFLFVRIHDDDHRAELDTQCFYGKLYRQPYFLSRT